MDGRWAAGRMPRCPSFGLGPFDRVHNPLIVDSRPRYCSCLQFPVFVSAGRHDDPIRLLDTDIKVFSPRSSPLVRLLFLITKKKHRHLCAFAKLDLGTARLSTFLLILGWLFVSVVRRLMYLAFEYYYNSHMLASHHTLCPCPGVNISYVSQPVRYRP